MLMNPNIYLIAAMAYAEDRRCRLDLYNNVLVSERDYVSNLTKGIRDFWQYRQLPCFAYSQTLLTHHERKFGCDAMLVVKYKDAARICLFEAKRIRFDNSWDSLQNSGISHFSDQLRRQSKWIKQAAIWEFFILGKKPGKKEPPHFDSWASTCIWHKDTFQFDKAYRDSNLLWKDSELKELVGSIRPGKPKNLISMLLTACQDKRGNYMPISNGRVTLTSSDGTDESVSIPATLQALDNLNLDVFCGENGIAHFLFIEIDDSES
ncbi:hypothetical protein NG798_24670 [Ancylothrix sp. C2]|uniref:hypothetical protein n=1 Tax=Ancylothrix sp. D3o TaxID=2953691 RepID=UPI0021BBB4E2|nr:hypothetical protein [Ancylothrix sp. D3o]MCT7952996.1 hypothetical protein [Ancylothrix sp. D3o]